MNRSILIGMWMTVSLTGISRAADSRKIIPLTLESAVDIAMDNSYQIKQLEMGIRRSMFSLKAQKAGLKTQIYMDLKTPDLQRISDYKWNSNLYRDEIVMQNTQLWQSDLSIKQPVMLFGFPTNGYLSLNYKLYKYIQNNGGEEVDLYNRLYLKYEQPFLLPNTLKNDLEEAELNLRDIQLEYLSDRVELMLDIADEYYELFELRYKNMIYREQIVKLEKLKKLSEDHAKKDSMRKTESIQVELEISDVSDELLNDQAEFRQGMSGFKQRLRMPMEDSLAVNPEIRIFPVRIDLDQALAYGYANNPGLKQLQIQKRHSEIDMENEKGKNAFHLTLEMTYGLEKKNHNLSSLWERFDNSNSVTLNAYIPIWDGGQRKASMQAGQINVRQDELYIEEEREDVHNDIVTAYTDLNEYYRRVENMKKSLEIADELTEESLNRYGNNETTLQDLLQIIRRHQNIEENFLEVYLLYRSSLLRLMRFTFYDFEKNISMAEDIMTGEGTGQ